MLGLYQRPFPRCLYSYACEFKYLVKRYVSSFTVGRIEALEEACTIDKIESVLSGGIPNVANDEINQVG